MVNDLCYARISPLSIIARTTSKAGVYYLCLLLVELWAFYKVAESNIVMIWTIFYLIISNLTSRN